MYIGNPVASTHTHEGNVVANSHTMGPPRVRESELRVRQTAESASLAGSNLREFIDLEKQLVAMTVDKMGSTLRLRSSGNYCRGSQTWVKLC